MGINNNISELETKGIGKLLSGYAFPAIIAMTAMSFLNVIDSIFIGHGVGSMALTGLTVTFPFMNLMVAFSTLVAVGGATLISIRMGQKDYESTMNILGNVVTMSLIYTIILNIVCLIFLDHILIFFGASRQSLPYAHDFMTIFLYGNIFTQLFFNFNALLRSSGEPKRAMISIIGMVTINLILNPIFIFGMHMGIKGSAMATVIAQAIMMFWQLSFFCNKKNFIHFEKGTFILRRKIVKTILFIGLSPFSMNIISCLIIILINNELNKHGGDAAVGAYGIINRFTYIFIMTVFGLVQGMQPIVGYNYGAKQYSRSLKTLKIAIIWATLITTIGFISGELFPQIIATAFTDDKNLIRQSANGMRAVILSYPIVGFQMVTTMFFESIGMIKKSIFLSLSRQLMFLVPLLIVLPAFFNLNGIWLSMPLSDLLSTIIAAIMLAYQCRIFKRHPESLPQV